MALTDGLTNFWPLSEASGNRVDVVGGLDLTDSGATGVGNFNPEFNPSKFGGPCAVFTGTTALYRNNATDFHVNNASDFSCSAWVKVSTGLSTTQAVVGKYNNEAGGLNWTIMLKLGVPAVGTDVIECIFANSDTERPSASFRVIGLPKAQQNNVDRNTQLNNPLTLGTWYHFVAMRKSNGTTYGCLNNGQIAEGPKFVVDPRTGPGQTSSVSQFAIGARRSSTGVFSFNLIGSVCNVGIWNRLLTSAEIGDLWNGGNGLDYPFTLP